jgi:hypothetical protein
LYHQRIGDGLCLHSARGVYLKDLTQNIYIVKRCLDMDSWIQILITVVTVAGSGAAFQFYTSRMKIKAEKEKDLTQNSDGIQYRDDLKNRVRNLEELLARSADEKDDMRQKILDLTAEVHSLRVKVDFLERENQALKMRT